MADELRARILAALDLTEQEMDEFEALPSVRSYRAAKAEAEAEQEAFVKLMKHTVQVLSDRLSAKLPK